MFDKAFFEHLAYNTDDLAAWLVYADWLIEQGDDRGYAIALSVQMLNKVSQEGTFQKLDDYCTLERRERWVRPFTLDRCTLFRGFPRLVSYHWDPALSPNTIPNWLIEWNSLEEQGLIPWSTTEVSFTDGGMSNSSVLAWPLTHANFKRLCTLHMAGTYTSTLGSVLRSCRLPRLKWLNLSGTNLGFHSLWELPKAEWFPGLKGLKIAGHLYDSEFVGLCKASGIELRLV